MKAAAACDSWLWLLQAAAALGGEAGGSAQAGAADFGRQQTQMWLAPLPHACG